MGKASRQLTNARNQLNEEIEENNKQESEDIENIFIDDINIVAKDEEIVFNIREEMLEFCDHNSYALCEYLDLENLGNFIKWLRKK
jgi:hypothetical protein